MEWEANEWWGEWIILQLEPGGHTRMAKCDIKEHADQIVREHRWIERLRHTPKTLRSLVKGVVTPETINDIIDEIRLAE